ncbi:hydroxymethylglutaryl-CoA lyase [Spirosoma daeguense]
MKIVECPRDAMQGLGHFVPTALKVQYLNVLLKVGFDTLDFGSFVSSKAIPQMRDTADVLAGLDVSSKTKLLVIVANVRGAEQAATFDQIRYVGFPLSVSETFQQRNTNKSIEQALQEVAVIQNLCVAVNKELVVYLSMGFGNPYGDPYSPELVRDFTARLAQIGVGIIAPSDTVGTSTPESIEMLFKQLIAEFPAIEFGAHLHARPGEGPEKVRAAIRAGVQRIDGALRGFGGCPMAADKLTGNLPTEEIIQTLAELGKSVTISPEALKRAMTLSAAVF